MRASPSSASPRALETSSFSRMLGAGRLVPGGAGRLSAATSSSILPGGEHEEVTRSWRAPFSA